MAFSILYVMKLFIFLVITCSCVLAEIKSVRKGYVNPYVLVRLKRSPQRAFTFSGFDPTNGLAAFATGADFYPYFQYPTSLTQVPYPQIQSRGEAVAPTTNTLSTEYKPPSFQYKPPSSEYLPPSSEYKPPSVEYQPPSSDYKVPSVDSQPPTFEYKPPNSSPNSELQIPPDYTSVNVLDEDQKVPSQNLTPPSETPPTSFYDLIPTPGTKRPKKKPVYVAPATDDDDEDEVGNSKSKSSSSSASFTAYFPIWLGTYPSSQPSRNTAVESLKDTPSAAVKDAPSAAVKDTPSAAVKDQREPVPVGGLGTTVIANSVSHGKSSVASSHAIAYGGDAPSHAQPYRNRGYN